MTRIAIEGRQHRSQVQNIIRPCLLVLDKHDARLTFDRTTLLQATPLQPYSRAVETRIASHRIAIHYTNIYTNNHFSTSPKQRKQTHSPRSSLDNSINPSFLHQIQATNRTDMYFACYSRLALGIALPSLALYLTPRTTTPEGKEAEAENIITRARHKLGGE